MTAHPPSTLDDYKKVSRLCSLCSRMCRHSCPTHLITRSDACSPVGRALIIELYRGGKSAFTETAVDRLYQCNLCGACKAWCKPRHELPHIIELARKQIVEEHRAPYGSLELDKNVAQCFNVYGEAHAERFQKMDLAFPKSSPEEEILYFVGCTTAYKHPEIANAASQVLTALDVSIQLLTGQKGEVCCGSPLLRAGFTKTAKSLAEQNVGAMRQSGIRTVITTCPGCARTLRENYPQLGVPLPKNIKVFHITEYLYKHHRKLAPLLRNPWKTKSSQYTPVFTYHDPCHLGRELGVYEQPRKLLNLIPSGQLIEFNHNRDHADCCGGGGVLPKTFPELAEEITQRRLADAISLSASYLISACPNCKLHFTETQTRQEQEAIEILDIMEVMAKALKVREGAGRGRK